MFKGCKPGCKPRFYPWLCRGLKHLELCPRLLLSPLPVLGPWLPELFFLACCGATGPLTRLESAGGWPHDGMAGVHLDLSAQGLLRGLRVDVRGEFRADPHDASRLQLLKGS